MATLNNVIANANGNVGIGTTSPTGTYGKLSVAGGIHILGDNNAKLEIGRYSSGASNSYIKLGSNSNSLRITNNTDAADIFTIENGGNVGIGTSSPTGQLHLYSSTSAIMKFDRSGTSTFGFEIGGTTFGLYDYTNSEYRWRAESRNLIINESYGNVGIGTTSPAYKLDVAGSVYGSNYFSVLTAATYGPSDNSAAMQVFGSTGSGGLTNTIKFLTGGSERVRIDNNGNIGIGTSSPSAKLQIGTQTYATAPDATYFVAGNDSFSGPGPVGAISGYPTTANKSQVTASIFDVVSGWEAVNGSHAILRVSAYNVINSTPAFVVLCNGNVGIGTTSPAAKLYVVSSGSPIARFDGSSVASSGATEIDVLGPQSNGDLNLGIGGSTFNEASNNIQNKAFITAGTGLTGLNLRSDAGYVQITTGGVASDNERMRITSDGKVGIGLTNPNTKLQVSGSATIGGYNAFYFGTGVTSLSITAPLYPVLAFYYGTTLGGILGAYSDHMALNTGAGGSKYISFEPGDSEIMRITAAGNVGIGTTNPTINGGGLHVYGSGQKGIRISGNSSNSYSVEIGCDATKMSYIQTVGTADRGLQLYTGNASTVVMTLTGSNVGIGMTSPEAKLQTYATNTGSQFLMSAQDGVNSLNFGLGFSVNSQTFATIAGYYTNSGGSGAGDLTFYTKTTSTSLSEKMRIQADGNVGIGTTNPGYKLHVANGDISIGNGNQTSGDFSQAQALHFLNEATTPLATIKAVRTNWAQGQTDLTFSTYNSGMGEKMRITTLGNVGIGTSSPGSKLHVVGAVYGTTSGQFGTAVANGANASFAVFGGNSTSVGVKLVLDSDVNRNDLVVTATSGNIGIGTNSAAYKLDVSTSIVSRSNISTPRFSSAGGYVYGITNSPSWNQSCGTYTNNNATAPDGTTSAGTYTLNSTCASYDLYQTISSLTVGRVYTIGMWVKLGTATNFCLVVNNTYSWNSIGGKAFTSSDGLSTDKWTHISFTFTAIAPGNINIHLGYHAETAVTQQTAGTVFLWNIEMTEFSSTWIGNIEDEIRLPGSSIWTSRGNVGIGTTSPTTKLAVSDGTTIAQVNPSSGVAYFGTVNNYPMALSVNSSEKVRILNDGNVGIGTSSPVRKLHIYGPQSVIALSNTGTGAWSGLQWSVGNGAYTAYSGLLDTDGRYFIDVGSNGDDFTILQNGNVGIGTTSPSVKLHVDGFFISKTLWSDVSAHSYWGNYSTAYGRLTWDTGLAWINATAGNVLYLGADGANKHVTIATSGNVGIGITSPTVKLTVSADVTDADVGQLRLVGSTSSAKILSLGYQTTSNYGFISAVIAGTGYSNLALQPNGGNVGIGTTSPSARLHVFDTNNSPATGNLLVTSTGGNASIRIDSNSTSNYTYFTLSQGGVGKVEMGIVPTSSDFYINPTVQSGANGAAIYIKKADGNVGIGTTGPATKLEVYGVVRVSESSSGGILQLTAGASAIDIASTFYGGSRRPITFTMDAEKVRIDTAGNVGIGTTSPDTLLNVHGANPFIRISNTSGDDHGIKISYNNSETHGLNLIYNANSAVSYIDNTYPVSAGYVYGDIYFRQKVSGTMTTRMTIKADGGNVGIGTTSPGYKLDVNGSCHATCFPTSSDIRFKKKITPLENSLEKIKKLQGVKYEWNEFVNSRRDGYKLNVPIIGLIAQDVEKVIPEIIDLWKLSDDCQDARSIEYPRLIPFLIEAIKEQQYQIEDLKNRLTVLENK